jgi:hypothetical protein
MTPTWVTDQKGNVYVNDMLRYIKGGLLVPPAAHNPLTIAAAPAPGAFTQSDPVIFEGGEDGVTEIYSFVGAYDAATPADAQNRTTVRIRDVAYRRQLMNRPIILNHVFGTNLQPFFLTESILLEGQQTMEFAFFNNSVAGNAIYRMALESRKLQASALANEVTTDEIGLLRQRKTFLNPYWLTNDRQHPYPLVIPAGGQLNVTFKTTRDYFLILQYIMCQAVTTGVAGDVQELISFTIRDPRTGRPLSNQPITLNNGAGTSQFPFVLPTALMVDPITSIDVTFNNLVTDQPTEVWFCFFGTGIFVADTNPWENFPRLERAWPGGMRRGAP